MARPRLLVDVQAHPGGRALVGCAPHAATISSRPVPRRPASRNEKYCPASPAIRWSCRSRPRISRRQLQPARDGDVVRTRRDLAARVVVQDDEPRRPRGEDGRDEDVRHGHLRARPRAARADVPGEQALAHREARDREHLHRLLREERRQRPRRGLRVVEDQRRQRDDVALRIAEGPIRTHELPHAMAGGGHSRERRGANRVMAMLLAAGDTTSGQVAARRATEARRADGARMASRRATGRPGSARQGCEEKAPRARWAHAAGTRVSGPW